MFQPADRTGLFELSSEGDILRRYRAMFGLGEEIGVAQIRRHADLEGRLTDELLASGEDGRAETFFAAYSKLYSELPWLAGTGTHSGAEFWARLLRPGSSVYEIGSGAGYLINFLAARGHACFSAELAPAREAAARTGDNGVTFVATDGVRLSHFAEENAFDYVLSDQVVEHLHPDDIQTHFDEARKILKPGGEYIVRVPYAPLGPCDLSRVFGLDKAVFMHLHEMRWNEIANVAHRAGFADIKAIFTLYRFGVATRSATYLAYMTALDRILTGGNAAVAALIKRNRKFLLLRDNIWVSLKK